MMLKEHLTSYNRAFAIGYEGDDGVMGVNVRSQFGSLVPETAVHMDPLMMLSGASTGVLNPGESTTLTVQAYPRPIDATVYIHGQDRNGVEISRRTIPVTVSVETTSSSSTTTVVSTTSTASTTVASTTTSSSSECPWMTGHSGRNLHLECMDGTFCLAFAEVGSHDGWNCCSGHGGRARCPLVFPFMCARPSSCADGTAHCCVAEPSQCEPAEGGLRTCGGDSSESEKRGQAGEPGGKRRLRGSSALSFVV